MTDVFEKRSTVVGIDGSPGSEDALRWAVEDARARRVPLRIVAMYAWVTRNPCEWHFDIQPPELGHVHKVADSLVAAAANRVRVENRELTVEGVAVEEAAVEGLLRESLTAGVLVLGSRYLGTLRAAVLGSVGSAVAARASCPVVVVRGPNHESEDGAVVVGIDGSDGSDDVIAFAFDYAQDHARPLRAVLGWRPVIGLLPRRSEPSDGSTARRLDEVLGRWHAKYPEVVLHAEAVEDHPVALLVERSRRDALVVVGSRGHNALAGTLLGSVSQGVLHHAECPVAVVPLTR
jgi:nucleotide-binding universal stress UspA family protein